MVAAILALLQSLPTILGMIKDLMSFINKVSGNDPQGFIIKVGKAFSQLNDAKTQEERIAAAKAISDSITGAH